MVVNVPVERGYLTQSLGSASHSGEHGFKAVPGLLKLVLENHAWERRIIVETGEEFPGFPSFEAYVKANPPRGLGASIELTERLISHDTDLLKAFRKALKHQGQRTERPQDNSEAVCKDCEKPIVQVSRGPYRREYCNDTCKMRYHRRIASQAKQAAQDETIVHLEARIATLEEENQALKERLDIELRFRTDVEVRHFKSWLRRQAQSQESDWYKRFIADTRLPQHASRSLYEAKMRLHGYSAEDITLFQDAWKTLMLWPTVTR